MTLGLELVLVVLTLVSGMIWLIWSLRQRGRGRASVNAPRIPWYVDYARSFFPVLLIVLILRSFVAEPFRIPSGSMMPTLLVGDFILVNKFAYGVRLPLTRTLILPVGLPERGDVAVFKYPLNPGEDYIKRVVGLPGDRIEFRNRTLYVNDEPQPSEFVERYVGVGSGMNMTGALRWRETLHGHSHEILYWEQNRGLIGSVTVPEGQYFLVGDNRDNSNDSRMWGFVPEELLVGKAILVWLNWDFQGDVRDFTRIGLRIH